MKILMKPLKVLSLVGLIAVSCTVLPAWTQTNSLPTHAQNTTSIEVVVIEQQFFSASNQPTVELPQGNIKQKPESVDSHNNIFQFAVIFNDKLQQILSAFSRWMMSSAHAETANRHADSTDINTIKNCKTTS